MCQSDVLRKEASMEAKVNRCGSARGDVRWVVRVGHIANTTLGQRLGVSHEDERRRMFLAKSTANGEDWKVGGCLACVWDGKESRGLG